MASNAMKMMPPPLPHSLAAHGEERREGTRDPWAARVNTPKEGGYIMAQRSSWGTNEPAARKGYRRLRYWADKRDGRGYRRCSETIRGSKRAGDARLAELRTLHANDTGCPTLGRVYADW